MHALYFKQNQTMKKITFGLLMTGMIALLLTPTSLFAQYATVGQNKTRAYRYLTQEEDSLKNSPSNVTASHRVQKKWSRFNGQNNSFTISPLELLLRTVHLNYTRYCFNQRIGFGIEGAYTFKFSSRKQFENNNTFDINGPTEMIQFMPFSDGSYASAFVKVYVEKRTPLNMFVSVAAFYRNTRFNNAAVSWEDQAGGSKEGVRYEYHDSLNVDQYMQGFKFLLGINPVIPMGKVSLDLEAYVGLSVRDVQTTLYHHDYYYIVGNQAPSIITPGKRQLATNLQEQSHDPSVVLPAAGIKVGLRF